MLIIIAPWWNLQNRFEAFKRPSITTGDKVECVILYVVGLQAFDRDHCLYSGPDSVLYASLLWIIFLFYSLVRFVITHLQNFCIDLPKHVNTSAGCMGAAMDRLRAMGVPVAHVAKEVSGVAFNITYNRTSLPLSIYMTCFWMLLYFGIGPFLPVTRVCVEFTF